METIISQYLLFLYIPIGIYIAHRICPKTHLFLRLILLFPTIAAIATIVSVTQHNTHLLDLLRECSSLLIYSLLALLLTGKRILKNIDSEKPCERK
jgi:hypothetical protein